MQKLVCSFKQITQERSSLTLWLSSSKTFCFARKLCHNVNYQAQQSVQNKAQCHCSADLKPSVRVHVRLWVSVWVFACVYIWLNTVYLREKDRNQKKMPPTKRRHANTKTRAFIHTSPAISNKEIFNRSLTALHFCARVSPRRITADDLTFS